MNEPTELEKLEDLLSLEAPQTVISFREKSAREIRYTLVIGTDNNTLLRKLAVSFGCPPQDMPWASDTFFEAGDDWHGRGELDLRELADELMKSHGEFFDFDMTIGELRALSHAPH